MDAVPHIVEEHKHPLAASSGAKIKRGPLYFQLLQLDEFVLVGRTQSPAIRARIASSCLVYVRDRLQNARKFGRPKPLQSVDGCNAFLFLLPVRNSDVSVRVLSLLFFFLQAPLPARWASSAWRLAAPPSSQRRLRRS